MEHKRTSIEAVFERQAAVHRQIWNLTLEEYRALWAPHWKERKLFALLRRDVDLPFQVGNVYIRRWLGDAIELRLRRDQELEKINSEDERKRAESKVARRAQDIREGKGWTKRKSRLEATAVATRPEGMSSSEWRRTKHTKGDNT